MIKRMYQASVQVLVVAHVNVPFLFIRESLFRRLPLYVFRSAVQLVTYVLT